MPKREQPAPEKPGDDLWGSERVAEYLEVSLRTLDNWARHRTGPDFSKVGRQRRYDPADIAAWVRRNKRVTAEPQQGAA